jgi:hypothetical protein
MLITAYQKISGTIVIVISCRKDKKTTARHVEDKKMMEPTGYDTRAICFCVGIGMDSAKIYTCKIVFPGFWLLLQKHLDRHQS